MAEVVVRKELDVPAARVWEVLRGFGDLAKWADGIEACSVEGEGVGAVRTLTVRGGISLRERLESFSDAERRYSYSIPGETVFPFSNYLSTVQVEDLGGERTRVDWRGSFEPKGDAAAGQNLVRGIYEGALASLAKRLGANLTPG